MKADKPFSFERVKDSEKLLLAMTSLRLAEFHILLAPFKEAWSDYKRQHGNVGRNNDFVSLDDMLLFVLYHLKCYPLQEILGYEFGMSQGQVNYWIHLLTVILRNALGKIDQLPERISGNLKSRLEEELEKKKEHEKTQNVVDKEETEIVLELAVDGTERRRQRPKDNEEQKKFYSGKKKAHTLKNNIFADVHNRTIPYLSGTYEGKKNDKKICDEEDYEFPKGTNLFQDKAFQGYQPDGVNVFQPKKKPKNGELLDEEKEANAIISGIRVIVEHVISGVKRLHVVKDVFRNTKDKVADLVMEVACGLHNFREFCRAPAR